MTESSIAVDLVVTARYYGRHREQVFDVVSLEKHQAFVRSFSEGTDFATSAGAFSLQTGWGLDNLSRWRLVHDDYLDLREKAGELAGPDKWRFEEDRMFRAPKPRKRAARKVNPKQTRFGFEP